MLWNSFYEFVMVLQVQQQQREDLQQQLFVHHQHDSIWPQTDLSQLQL